MDAVSSSASVIFQFDRKNKKITLVKAKDFGEDTGIFISMRNLINRFEINSSSNDELITKLIPTGSNNLGIEQVNFGKDYIINLDYFMNTLNEYGDYKYVSKELHDKYIIWQNYRETDKITFNGKQYTRREQYIELTKLYNHTILAINDLKNRVPNDGAVTDYKTFSLEELKLHLNAFNKALVSLITIYKNEYGVTEIGNAPNYTPTPSSAVNIKNTPYWHDFYAYQESIIPQIKEALKMYCQTDSNGNLMTDINGHFIEMGFGNPAYYADPSIVKEVDAYKYEWSLYGLDELESKKKAWSEVSNILFNECFIKSGTIAAPTSYRTPDDNGWNSLSDKQRKEFASKSAYIDKLNQYLDYMSFDERSNSLTKTKCKGIIRLCNDAILTRKNEIKSLEDLQNNYSVQRINLANSVSLENFKANNNVLFTEKDLNVINSMIREKDYNDPNVLITNLDDIVSTINAQEELYQATIEELYILSQPQYSFQTELDNLYALEEFQSYHDDFDVGNFIRVGLEIHEEIFNFDFRKLRLISIEYNPLQSDENLSIEFSTMERGLENVSDMSFLIGKDNSTSSGGSSSSSGGGGTYGNNDANVQMSNNMLNALLSTELFGTTVTDVILDSIKGNKGNFNTLLSHSGVFDSLEAGRIKISGECLFDIIKSSNYIAGKSGSMLDLLTGNFDFAGGKLKWDNDKLSIEGSGKFTGDIIANSLKLGQDVKIDNTSISGLSKVATTGDFNDLSNTSDILMTDDVSIESTTDLNGVTTKTINVGEHTYTTKESDNYILTNVGLGTDTDKHDQSFFKVSKNGLLEANNALIYGTIYATDGRFSGDIIANSLTANQSGTIAGWTFDNNGFYKENSTIASNGMYLGNDGISVGDFFVVKKDGLYIKSKDWLSPTYSNYIGDDNVFLFSLHPSQYIKVYLYNVIDIDYFELSWNCDFEYEDWGNGGVIEIEPDIKTEFNKYCICGWSIDRTENSQTYYVDGENVVVFTKSFEQISETINKMLLNSSNSNIITYIAMNKFYSVGRTMSNKYFHSVQIGKIEIYNSDNTLSNTIYGTRTNSPTGMMINTFMKHIYTDVFTLSNKEFSHTAVCNTTTSNAPNLYINSDGRFMKSSSSSKRYKNHITSNIPKDIAPEKLYDLNIVSYMYNENYLFQNDRRIGKNIIGFIAEDVSEKYPIACNFNKDGEPEMWEINILFPAALKLIQEQHKEIIALSEQIETMKQQFQKIKTCIIN